MQQFFNKLIMWIACVGVDQVTHQQCIIMYNWGLSGTPGSAERKYQLLNALGLPPRLSKKELVEALNRLYSFEQLDTLQAEILEAH